MERQQIKDRVIELVADQANYEVSEVSEGTRFVGHESLGFDSLDCVEIVMEFEDEFDIEIPDEEAEKWQTVKNAIDYIEFISTDFSRR